MFSIIIPVYNTPIYHLKRCITSIISQDYNDYEIIIIDDGSNELLSSQYDEIINNLSNKIQIIHQSNNGVSAARNKGIELSQGDYIIFVDADDELTNCFFSSAEKIVIMYPQVDFIIGNIKYIPGNEILQGNNILEYINENNIQSLRKAFLGLKQSIYKFPISGSPCAKLYKAKIAKKINFPVGVTHWEDQIFNRQFLNQIDNAIIVPECWYLYHQNEFSAMHNNFNINYIENSRAFWNNWHSMNQELLLNDYKQMCIKSLDFYYSSIHLNIIPLKNSWNDKRRMMKELAGEKIFQDSIKILTSKDITSLYTKVKFYLLKYQAFFLIYNIVKLKTLKVRS